MARLLLSIILLSISFSAAGQDWQWVRDGGSSTYGSAKSIATDGSGNSYVTGNFARSVTFGSTTLTGGPDGNVFIVKYDNNGGLIWGKKINGTSVVEGMDIAASADGYTYVTGNFKGTATFGAFTLTSPDDRGAFVAKFDTNGNVVWAKQASSSDGDVKGEQIAVDATGNSYVTGNFFKSARFGSVNITATKDEQLFIAKYDASGNVVWVKMVGGLGSCFTHDITADNNGNLYLAGQFWLTATFGATTLTNFSDVTRPADIFIAKYDANGNALWARQAGGPNGNDVATGIVVDADGNSYLTGYFQNRATFGSTTVTGNGAGNLFLAKYNSTGGLQWIRKQEGSSDARGVSIGRGSHGHLYVGGFFSGSITLGDYVLDSYGNYDMLFAEFNANGDILGAMQGGGTGMDVVKKLEVSGNGGIYFTGEFEGPGTFGNATLLGGIATGKLNSIGTVRPILPTLTTGTLGDEKLCHGKYLYVSYSHTGSFFGGNNFTVQLSDAKGSFQSPTAIGTGRQSPILAQIPSNVAPGTGYRIRVVSSFPVVTGTDNGVNLTVPVALAPLASIVGQVKPCGGTSGVQYTIAAAAGAEAYTWSVPEGWAILAGQGTTSISVAVGTKPGNVTVTASNACAQVSRSLAVAPVTIALKASATSDVILAGASTFLLAEGADSYTWSPAAGLSNSTIADPVATPLVTTTYTVTGTRNGCTTTSSVTITVKPDPQVKGRPSDWKWVYEIKSWYDFHDSFAALAEAVVTTDAEGNVYVAGQFGGELMFGSKKFDYQRDLNIVIAKFNAAGTLLWIEQAGGSEDDVPTGMVTDAAGNLYIMGRIGNIWGKSVAKFGHLEIAAGDADPLNFVAKYDKDGKVQWVKNVGKGVITVNRSIMIDKGGDLYISGFFAADVTLGSQRLSSPENSSSAFLAKFSKDWDLVWAKQSHGKSMYGVEAALDAQENVYLVGSFYGTVTVGSLQLSTNNEGWSNGFLVKFDRNGKEQWARSFGDGIQSGGTSVVADAQGDAYVTGYIYNKATFGDFIVEDEAPTGDRESFMVKYSADGRAVWVRQPRMLDQQKIQHQSTTIRRLAFDKKKNVLYALGTFTGGIGFGEHSLIEYGGYSALDVFISAYGIDGTALGAVRAGGIGSDAAQDLALDPHGNIYALGNHYGDIADFGGALQLKKESTWRYGNYTFLAKLQSITTVPVPTVATGALAVSQLCAGATVSVPYTLAGNFSSDSRFEVQLSDANGSFASGTVIGTGAVSPILATIPQQAAAGEKYRVRVISTMPSVPVSDNGANIRIVSKPTVTISTTSGVLCPGTTGVVYTAISGSDIISYTWTVPAGWVITAGQGTGKIEVTTGAASGMVSVQVSNSCGISATHSIAVMTTTPSLPATQAGTRCGTGSVTLRASGAPIGGVYNWYSTQTGGVPIATGESFVTPELSVTTTYYVSVVNDSGCEGFRVAAIAEVQAVPAVTAGPDATVCVNTGIYTLTGQSPVNGTWSGRGVTTAGKFDPMVAGVGVHELTYTYTYTSAAGCSQSDTRIVTVTGAPAVTLADFDNLCSTTQDHVLTGGQPLGGTYSGTGVVNGLFTPIPSVHTYPITYTYTTDAGCTISVTKVLTVTTCTGIAESQSASKLTVYPIPARENIYVELPLETASSLTLTLYDTKGQTVLEQHYPRVHGEFRQVLSLRNRARGVYMLQLVLEDGVIIRRVVLE